ncbi:MAG: hypothetical protein KatS3mg085_692 [Candidatus Dojkabacteria bacterium]|nr:MAG: hypothetical protein KatS3mg085_692 [Candidatus Dojkabacteria bacterium]
MVSTIIFIIFGFIIFTLFSLSLLNPIPRKVGVRNVRRRIGNTALVVLGSMVGTALICGALVMSDSLDATFLKIVKNRVGEVDANAQVFANQNYFEKFLTQSEVDEISNKLQQTGQVDGFLPAIYLQVSPQKIRMNIDGSTIDNFFGVDFYGIDFEQLKNFGSSSIQVNNFKNQNGIVISKEYSEKMDLRVGDEVRVILGNKPLILKVEYISDEKGVMGGEKIFADIYYVAQNLNFNSPKYNYFFISHVGGVIPDDYDAINFSNILSSIFNEFTTQDRVMIVDEIKQEALDGYGLKIFVTMFIALSMFGILAGILLIINLYMMLASERKFEMGILRAIALTKRKLALSFVIEGAIYSLISSFVGVIVGVGIGYLITYFLQSSFQGILKSTNSLDLEIVFDFDLESLVIAFCVGSIITILTTLFVSLRISNFSIVSAIRDLSEEKAKKINLKWILGTLGIFLLTINFLTLFIFTFFIENFKDSFFQGLNEQEVQRYTEVFQGYSFYLGLTGALIFGAILLGRITWLIFKKDMLSFYYTLSLITLIVVTVMMPEISYLTKLLKYEEAVGLIFISGVNLVVASAIITSFNLVAITKLIKIIFSPASKLIPVFMMGLRYPSFNRSRTGFTLLMFSLVIFLISFISIEKASVDSLADNEVSKNLGGYELVIVPNTITRELFEGIEDLIIDIEKTENVIGVEKVINMNIEFPNIKYKDLENKPYFGNPNQAPIFKPEDNFSTKINVVSREYINLLDLNFLEFKETFQNESEVWDALFGNKDYVVLGTAFNSQGYGPMPNFKVGDKIKISDLTNTKIVEKEVIGILEPNTVQRGFTVLEYLIIPENTVIEDFGLDTVYESSDAQILVDINNEVSEEVKKTLKEKLSNYNIVAFFDVNDLSESFLSFIKSLYRLTQGFLAFSLIVGASGLAIIITRSVNERKQQIGMLRSLGFQKQMILLMFFIESTFIATIAIILGVAMGVIGTVTIFNSVGEENPNLSIIVPWGEIIFIAILIYLFSMLFALLPSIKASKLSPVEATNYVE